MRKLLYTLAGLSALALFASCNKEAQLSGDEDGATVKASFTVQLPDAVQTKAISDGLGATQLLFKVYDQNDKHLPNLDQTITVSNRTATVTVNLVKGVKYQYVFWAQKEDKYTINDTDNSITIDPQAMMNSDDWDAFYWHEPLEEVTAAFSKTITLRRPFAQINVGAPVTLDANEERTGGDFWAASQSNILIDNNLTTSYTIEVPNKLNLLDGTVDGAASVTMNAVAHPTEFLTVDGVKYDYAAMAYVLAGTTGTTKDLVLKLNTKQNGTAIELTRNVPNVPLRRNYRTNILGNVFTVTGTFNIVVDQNFFKVDGYNDDYFPQYASIDALNAAFAAGKGIGYTVEVAPAAAVSGDQTIVLPNTQDEVSIFFRGDFSAADITIAYSSEAEAKKPAKLTIEAPLVGSATQSINKLIGNLPATTVVLAGTTTVNTADFHTASNTLHIMPKAKIRNQLTVYAGSLLVEGFIQTAIIDPAVAVNTVDAVATVAEDGEVVRFVVQNLTTKIESGAKVDTLEVSTTAAYTGAAPTVTIEGGAAVAEIVASTETGSTVAPTVAIKDDAEVGTVEQKGTAVVDIAEDAQVGEVEAENISNITGDGAEDVEFLIKNEAQLTAAIEAQKASMKIGADFACNRGYLLDYSAEIDLNGYAITFNGVPGEGRTYVAEGFTQSRAFKVVGSADFTLKNGSVLLNEALLGSVRFDSTGKLTLENYVTTNSRGWGLNIKLEKGTADLKNVTITSVVGGGIEVNGPAKATLTNCTMTQTEDDSEPWISAAIGVAYGGEVTVNGGTYTGAYGCYVYTTGGTANLNSGTFTGRTKDVEVDSGEKDDDNNCYWPGYAFVQANAVVNPENCLTVSYKEGVPAVIVFFNEEGDALIKNEAELQAVLAAGKTTGKVGADFEVVNPVGINSNFTLNLNGFTITNSVPDSRLFRVYNSKLTINGADAEGKKGSIVIPDDFIKSYGFVDLRSTTGSSTGAEEVVVNDTKLIGATTGGSFFAYRKDNQSITLTNVDAEAKIGTGAYYDGYYHGQNGSIVNGYNIKGRMTITGGTYIYDSRWTTYGVFQLGKYSILPVEEDPSVPQLIGVKVVTTCGPVLECHGSTLIKDCDFSVGNKNNDYHDSAVSTAEGANLVVDGGSYEGHYGIFMFSSGGNIEVKGGSFKGTEAAIITTYDKNYAAYAFNMVVKGGFFDGPIVVAENTSVQIQGGTFTVNPSAYVASDYQAVDNGNGTWTVTAR